MKIPPGLISPFLKVAYRLWCSSFSYTEVNREKPQACMDAGTPVVFAMWHDELFAAPFMRRDWRLFTIVSRSTDGEYLARILQSVGIETVRGSSSRGGLAALLRAAKLMRDKKMNACITVDGPRGPRHEIKDGVTYLAYHARSYLVPVRVWASRAKLFNSWDKFQLPLPFSKVALSFGDPYKVASEELTPENLAKERAILKENLERALHIL